VKNYRDLFIRGDLNARSLTKPYGYAGDFEIIDDIYLNQPKTNGFDRLFDNYFQMSSVCNAVRNRKEDFKRIIIDFINTNYWRKLRILDLASGPCRELLEMGLNPHVKKENIEIDCLDHDPRSLFYAKRLLEETPLKVDFKVQNALKLCTERSVQKILPHKYDLIYSTGLFDYLSDRTTISLIASLYSCLNPGGVLVVSDVRDKGSNPSAYYMEWVGEWELTYKEDGELFDCFVSAGIEKKKLNIQYEQQGIFQYILAKR
jgi:SAM-dependent methyltransferase